MAVKDGKQGGERVQTYGKLVRNWRGKIIEDQMMEEQEGKTEKQDQKAENNLQEEKDKHF